MHNNKHIAITSRTSFYVAIIAAHAGLIASPSTLYAADPTVETIDVISRPIVDSTRLDNFSSTSSVITAAQLRDQNAVDLASALRRTPGVQISRFNPVGSFGGGEGGAVYIRGMGVSRPGSEIKTYIDGVPFYMGAWNHPLLDLLPINAMSSITVLKGPQPQSSSNNFASVNLRTRQATEEGLSGNARLSAGSFNTVVEQLTITGKKDGLDFLLAQGAATSDGHRADSEGKLKNLLGRVGWHMNDVWSVSASVLTTDNEAQDPGDERVIRRTVAPEYNTSAKLLTGTVAHVQERWTGELRIYSSEGSGDWLQQPANTFTNFDTSGFAWNERVRFPGAVELQIGADSHRVSGDVVEAAARVNLATETFEINSWSAAVSREFTLNAQWTLTPSIGVRTYSHSEFNDASTPHAGVTLASERVELFANFSEGINYPGLEAPVLAAYIPPLGVTWRKLDAEELEHAEIGGSFNLGAASTVSVSLFEDDVSNRYVFGFPPLVAPPPQFINLGSYEISGTEVSFGHQTGENLRVFAALTTLDASRKGLPYTPERAMTVGVNAVLGGFRLALDAQYQSDILGLSRARAASAVNTQELDAFTVVNARFSYPLGALGTSGEIFMAAENLFDREYQYQPGYTMAGTGVQLGVSASF